MSLRAKILKYCVALVGTGLLTLTVLDALYAQGGGYPSYPNFQAVNVGNACAGISTTGQICVAHIGLNGSSPTNINALNALGSANQYTAIFTGNSTSGQSFGPQVNAGTTSGDIAFSINNATVTQTYMQVYGDGGVIIGNAPTGGDKGIGNLNISGSYFVNNIALPTSSTGSFTSTLSTGCTTSPTLTIHYAQNGPLVTLWSNTSTGYNCTSNSTSKNTDASVPSALRPSSNRCITGFLNMEDNSTAAAAGGNIQITTTGVLNFGKNATGTGATNCGGPNTTAAGSWATDQFSVTYDIT